MLKILIINGFCLLSFVVIFLIGKIYRDKFFMREPEIQPGIALNALNLSRELKRYLGKIVARDPRSRRSESLP